MKSVVAFAEETFDEEGPLPEKDDVSWTTLPSWANPGG